MTNHARTYRRRRGSASIAAVLTSVLLLGMGAAILSVSSSHQRERTAAESRHRAFFAADSGIAHALANLNADVTDDVPPQAFAGGTYEVDLEPNADGTFTIVSTAVVGRERVALEAVAAPAEGGVFDNAVFAGNTSEDPLYTLELGGLGGQADEIVGNVYSGANVRITGDATVTGDVRAVGNVFGEGESTAPAQPVPDLVTPDYSRTADYDVRALFEAAQADGTARREWDDAGGIAWQLPESHPAHVFRLNPSDRRGATSATTKDDYFLEDPYEELRVDSGQTGADPWAITLSGAGEPGPDGNGKVYYVDGNLWLHNLSSYSFRFERDDADGTQVTFVVKGNIYFSDNLFYQDALRDGVAFIAMEDPDEQDSGNIYFGDPEFGTLRKMQAYMYAEKTFYDVNLDEDGSTVVELTGIMSAGDKVDIQRDYGNAHTKLMVEFDPRVSNGSLELPGLPPLSGAGEDVWTLVSWRRIALP